MWFLFMMVIKICLVEYMCSKLRLVDNYKVWDDMSIMNVFYSKYKCNLIIVVYYFKYFYMIFYVFFDLLILDK